MRRERVAARILPISRKPRESKQKMKKRKTQKRRKVGLDLAELRSRAPGPASSCGALTQLLGPVARPENNDYTGSVFGSHIPPKPFPQHFTPLSQGAASAHWVLAPAGWETGPTCLFSTRLTGRTGDGLFSLFSVPEQ
jgi:hypothetical protein